MNNIDRSNEINENIEMFLTFVTETIGKKQLRGHFINLTMVYKLETDDFEILLDQVDGRLSSINKVKNNGLGLRNCVKPKINKRQAKEIRETTKYFMGHIREAQKDCKIEIIILNYNVMNSVADIFFGHPK